VADLDGVDARAVERRRDAPHVATEYWWRMACMPSRSVTSWT
jgi:hypothetical protein